MADGSRGLCLESTGSAAKVLEAGELTLDGRTVRPEIAHAQKSPRRGGDGKGSNKRREIKPTNKT